MAEQSAATSCPRCGEKSAGRFCPGCGTALRSVACASCGEAGPPGALFCPSCGAKFGAAASPTTGPRRSDQLTRLIGGAAVLVLVAFVAGVATGRRLPAGVSSSEQIGSGPADGRMPLGAATAPDISSMSPEERASRLFNRVMTYSEQGKQDSARFFAPMAIQAYEMIGPPDAHAQYDIGVISAAVGDVARARAEADTILAARPKHLLGLVLAIRAAELARDSVADAEFRRRLLAAEPTERSALKEYAEHSRDIDDALKKATATQR
jgi:hypothetical protein